MTAMTEMPRYKSHKTVWALQIGEGLTVHSDGSVTLPIVDPGYAPVTVERGVVARYMPMPGDYYVQYADGYKSISPRKAFLEGYKPEETPVGAPKLSPEHIEAQIVSVVSGRASVLFKDVPQSPDLQRITICLMTLRNGCVLVGQSACAAVENYDEHIGHQIAYDDAKRQIWALEGYLLRERLSARS